MLSAISENTLNIYTNRKQVAFSSNRLLLLRKTPRTFFEKFLGLGNSRTIDDCFFSEMTKEDIPLVEKALPIFENKIFGEKILKGFLYHQDPNLYELPYPWFCSFIHRAENQHFYMLEAARPKSAASQIKGLTWLENRDEDLFVSYIQAATPFSKNQLGQGEGTSLMYGILRLAEKLNKINIKLFSGYPISSWYKRLGFTEHEDGLFVLKAKDFEAVGHKLERKLKISHPEFLNPFIQ